MPDIEKMISASKHFLGTHDFKGFSSVKKTNKSTVRTINSLEITQNDGIIKITINGNGFLYNMVRIIAGTILDIGTGKINEDVILKVFSLKNREMAGTTLPAQGLKLVKVFY